VLEARRVQVIGESPVGSAGWVLAKVGVVSGAVIQETVVTVEEGVTEAAVLAGARSAGRF
jgi:hypothetical protein